MTQAANLVTFPQGTNNGIWISTYSEACLSRKSPGTIDVYQRVEAFLTRTVLDR